MQHRAALVDDAEGIGLVGLRNGESGAERGAGEEAEDARC
jgi:hypothetical protein